jgi:hypothetical protein
LNPSPKTADGKAKGKDADRSTGVIGTVTAVPGSLGGRTTVESMPVHMPSQGFREGGERGITKIDKEISGNGGPS